MESTSDVDPAIRARNSAHTRDRILAAASELLAQGGVDALSNRAVASAAGVQAPTIYRLFGDKQGLLDALAARQFEDHLVDKASLKLTADPVEDLRAGWDQHVNFGLQHPSLYVMVYGDPRPGPLAPAAAAASRLLAEFVHRVAEAGLLTVDEVHAAQLMHASGRGVTLTLLGMPAQERDMTVSRLAREAVISAITVGEPVAATASVAARAIALRAVLDQPVPLTVRERALMEEWLERITAGHAVEAPR